MKHLLRIGLLFFTVMGWVNIASAATPLEFGNTKGWRVEEVAKDPTLAALFAGSDYVFFVEDQSAEERPIIRVRELKDATDLKTSSASSWQKAIFADKSRSQIVTAQKVFKKGGEFKYVAEFQTDMGTESMLYSVVLAAVVNGKIQILTYEQRREAYQKNIASIKTLFENLTLQKVRTTF